MTRNRKRLLPPTVLLAVCAVHAGTVEPARFDTIRDLIDRGQYVEAERRARFALEDIEGGGAPSSIDAANALDLIVESLRKQDRAYTPEVAAMAARALAIRRRHTAVTGPGIASSLSNMAFVRRNVDLDLPGALRLSEEALREAESAFGAADSRLVPFLTGRAHFLLDAAQYEEARILLQKADTLRDSGSPPWHRAAVPAAFGRLLYMRRDFVGATEKYEEAGAIFEREFGPDHPDVTAMIQGQIYALGHRHGYQDEKWALERRCVAAAERSYGREHPLVGRCLVRLAAHERGKGSPILSRKLYEEAVSILERAYGPKHPVVATALRQLAFTLMVSGELADSKALYERVIRIMESFYGERDQRMAWDLIRYGTLLRQIGDLSGAERAFERAIELIDSSPEPDVLRKAQSVESLALLRQSRGDIEGALALFEEAMPVLDRELPDVSPERTDMLRAYAGLLAAAGENTRARIFMERALEMRKRIFWEGHIRVADHLVAYADLLEDMGDHLRAIELRREALAIREEKLGPDAALVGRLLGQIARDELATGNREESLQAALAAERIRRDVLRLTVAYLPERQAIALAESWRGSLDVLLTAASHAVDARRLDAREPWDALVRSRAIVFDELAARHRSIHTDAADRGLIDELKLARERLAGLLVRGPGDDYRERMLEARERKEALESVLAARSADFRRLRRQADVGLADVEAALPSDSALVAFVRFSRLSKRSVPSYAAFVRSTAREQPRLVPLGSADEIDSLLEVWRSEVSREPPSIKALQHEAMRSYLSAAGDLREAVWDPVVEDLEGARRVFIVPDGSLHLLNFATLSDEDGRFLIDGELEFHYLSSERDLVTGKVDRVASRLLALGGPDYDARPGIPELPDEERIEVARLLGDSDSAPGLYRGEGPDCEDFRSVRFRELHGASREIDEVSRLWGDGRQVNTLKGALAHESLLKAQSGDHDAIHLATHSFMLDGTCHEAESDEPGETYANPLLSAGLALAGANNRDEARPGEDDGILTAEEVGTLDLGRVGWVVLSGCATGTGRVVAGEGVLGLRRAFRIAGARSLIMSLWPVDDDATRRWMRSLYAARRNGASTSGSVTHAARAVLRENVEAGLPAHPFYWGAFVAAGDWR